LLSIVYLIIKRERKIPGYLKDEPAVNLFYPGYRNVNAYTHL